MIPYRVIEAKRDGKTLGEGELTDFLQGFLSGGVADYQMSAFLMAVFQQGLAPEELTVLVEVMLHSGEILDFSTLGRPVVDKHSTGGVGDKVSLVLAPLAAELGLAVPMMSGRGLGHTGGTLDKLEAIPGFRTDLTLGEFREVLASEGFGMIGQTHQIAPLDRRLYALRSVTGTVPSLPLIAASIMSKKLAEGLQGLVLDVKVGSGAFLPDQGEAQLLAQTMVEIGEERGVATVALLTAMDRPLGRTAGNALEVKEALECLRGGGPEDLRELTVALAVEMLAVGGGDGEDAGALRARVESALDSGGPLERFARVAAIQGGDPEVVLGGRPLPSAPVVRPVHSRAAGTVARVVPERLGYGVIELGGGRRRLDDTIDPAVGFEIRVGPGDEIGEGDLLGFVHARDESGADGGELALREACRLSKGDPPPSLPLLIRRVDRGSQG